MHKKEGVHTWASTWLQLFILRALSQMFLSFFFFNGAQSALQKPDDNLDHLNGLYLRRETSQIGCFGVLGQVLGQGLG